MKSKISYHDKNSRLVAPELVGRDGVRSAARPHDAPAQVAAHSERFVKIPRFKELVLHGEDENKRIKHVQTKPD